MSSLVDVTLSEEDREGTTAVVQSWLKQPGDAVSAHEPVAELETDKVVMELAAPCDGVLVDILRAAGEEAVPGDVLARIDPAGSGDVAANESNEPAAAPSVDSGGAGRGARLSPAVRRLAAEHGVDVATIAGSGEGGRVTARDVEAAAADRPETPTAAASSPGGSRLVPHDRLRRRIANHMVESLLHTAPHVTSVFEVDLGAVLRHRAEHRAEFERQGRPLTLTAYFVAASARALAEVPEINSRFHDEHLELFDDINIGIGTALADKGLVVPVLKRVQDMDLAGIAEALHRATESARAGTLAPADVRGGTFTISNHGVGGSLLATPIVINQPQSAILGVGKLEKRIKVVEVDGEDTIRIRPMCYVTLTIDHRALDAWQTNRFLTCLVETLEGWGR